MPMLSLKKGLAEELSVFISLPDFSDSVILSELGAPPNLQLGHVAFPCFRLAKIQKKPANEIAKDLAKKLEKPGRTTAATGPYVNVRWEPALLMETLMRELSQKGKDFAAGGLGEKKKILIEYCSPNIAKRLAFHHIRSTLIGHTLSNVYRFLGFDVVRINFVGDWGAQFARLLAAVEKWGDPAKLEQMGLDEAMIHLGELYIRFHKDLDNHPEWLDEANKALHKLETSDPGSVRLWTFIREISLKSMNRTLSRLGVSFDLVEGESIYIAAIDRVLQETKQKAQARLSEGAWIVDVEGASTPALIQKKDGTTLYLTRDIAAALDRFQRYSFEKMLYVVSEQQRLHFQLLFGVLKKMGFVWSDKCEHLSFGTVLFGSEAMSTRDGKVVLLDDTLNQAKALALEECTTKNPDLKNKEEVAEKVGIGAVVFGELSAHRTRDIEFDWKQILSFEGETGPYVQYALVRCVSLLGKAKVEREFSQVVYASYVFAAEEEALVVLLSRYREALHQVVRDNEPYHLTHFLIDIAKAFNRFYYRFPVVQAEDMTAREIRLNLVRATRSVLESGLKLLGIACPDEM